MKEPTCILISAHYSVLETDTQHLVRKLPEETDCTIYICLNRATQQTHNELANKLINDDSIKVIKSDSIEFVKALCKSRVVITRANDHLHGYRFFAMNHNRTYIRFDHGIITKSYGKHSASYRNSSIVTRIRNMVSEWYFRSEIDIYSVGTDVERFYRSSAESLAPNVFRKYGYPRYDRIHEFLETEMEPMLKSKTHDRLTSECMNILYAPTHKDDSYLTTIFPFDEFDPDDLRAFLDKNDMRLFIRMHPKEEDHPQYHNLIDGKTVFPAGQQQSHSSVELLPYIDVMITDYSSIYMDFLPFDKPILFIHDNYENYKEVRGLAFDYNKYFPGEKINDYTRLKKSLTNIKNDGCDRHKEDRIFVSKVLLPSEEISSVEKITKHLENTDAS